MSISSRSHVSRTWESVTKTKVCLNRRKRCFGAQYLSCLCLWVSHSARWQEILHHLKSVLNIDLHQDLWVLLFWVLNCCYLEHTPFGRVTFWSESTFTLFPIFLIMLLPPPAHWKPSGSIGSGHPWGKWGGGVKYNCLPARPSPGGILATVSSHMAPSSGTTSLSLDWDQGWDLCLMATTRSWGTWWGVSLQFVDVLQTWKEQCLKQ